MTVSNGDIVQVVVDFTLPAGHHIQNKLVFEADFGADQTDVAVIAALNTYIGNLYDNMAGLFVNSLDDPDIFVDLIEWSIDHWETVQRIGEGIAGTNFNNGSETLPLQCACVGVRRTSKPRSRGRVFIPPFGEDTQQAGILTGPTMADVTDFLDDLLTACVVVVGSELLGGVASDKWGIFLPALNAFANDLVRTQRRRVPGVGY